ncbi:hypothetical protein LguiA_011936 [Lonicera macranthoides]
MEKKGEVVCVTGGSGFISSWLVRLLLDRGYTVHTIVKDLSQFIVPLFDEKETKHLQALDGAELHLHLFQIDLLKIGFRERSSLLKQLLAPAIKGTNNVLTAAKGLGVQRVVVTSSIGAITPSHNWPADVVKNEDCWTDVEDCKQNGTECISTRYKQSQTTSKVEHGPQNSSKRIQDNTIRREKTDRSSPYINRSSPNINRSS